MIRQVGIGFCVFGVSAVAQAANFNITVKEGTTLPTMIGAGGLASAYYTVTNQTNSARNGYVVQGLPQSVTQNTTGLNCGNPLNLDAHASCTLQLDITAPVVTNFALCLGSSCTTAATPLNVVLEPGFSQLLVGSYDNFDYNVVPLLAERVSNTSSWVYPPSIITNLPSDYEAGGDGLFDASSLTSGLLIAAGYYNNAVHQYPWLAQSSGMGDWTYSINSQTPALPDDFSDYGLFNATACVGLWCVAAGSYYSIGSYDYPLLAQTTDAGQTWSYAVDGANAPSDIVIGGGGLGFFSAACGNDLCIAAGGYAGPDYQYPLLMQSIDHGSTWVYQIDSQLLPEDYANSGQFNGAACDGGFCIAAGGYVDLKGETNLGMPLVAQNNGPENSWVYSINGQSPGQPSNPVLPEDYFSGANFSAAACSSQICVAAGQYNSSAEGFGACPLLAQTTNQGTDWIYSMDCSTSTLPSDYSNEAVFRAAGCSGNFCIAVGYYNNGNAQVPLLAQTRDAGQTWAYVSQGTWALPSDFVYGYFTSAACSGNTCLASGQYSNNQGYFPLAMQSIDGGVTWTATIDSSSVLPSDYFNCGSFFGSCLGAPSMLPDSLQVLRH